MSSKKRSLDLYLSEVFKQFIAIKDNDLKQAQEVFKSAFEQVKQKMGEQCNYFKKYSKQDMYAGSVYDGIKVSKMDEFDMDIVIRLPINYADIILENDQPGFVKLKTNAFDNMDKQQDWEKCHKVTRDWQDTDKYLLQNKFRQWLHGLLQKALNSMEGKVTVCGYVYLLTYKESGPAFTLIIRNDDGNNEFKLDVDLVPVIKFMYPRAPSGYRVIDGIQAKDWLVVPKPNKFLTDKTLKNRCWRLSFQEQEREIIKGCQALKTTIRLVKKLRDGLGMKKIASYYIKSLFLKKVMETKDDKTYWQNKLSFLFRTMVEELHIAIKNKNIPFFWNCDHNLIETLKDSHQQIYAEKLGNLIAAIDANDVDKVVGALLTSEEMKEFRKSDVYQKYSDLSQTSVTDSTGDTPSLTSQINSVATEMSNLPDNYQKDKKFAALEAKVNDLIDRVTTIEDRLRVLERLESSKEIKNNGNVAAGCLLQI